MGVFSRIKTQLAHKVMKCFPFFEKKWPKILFISQKVVNSHKN